MLAGGGKSVIRNAHPGISGEASRPLARMNSADPHLSHFFLDITPGDDYTKINVIANVCDNV